MQQMQGDTEALQQMLVAEVMQNKQQPSPHIGKNVQYMQAL